MALDTTGFIPNTMFADLPETSGDTAAIRAASLEEDPSADAAIKNFSDTLQQPLRLFSDRVVSTADSMLGEVEGLLEVSDEDLVNATHNALVNLGRIDLSGMPDSVGTLRHDLTNAMGSALLKADLSIIDPKPEDTAKSSQAIKDALRSSLAEIKQNPLLSVGAPGGEVDTPEQR